jgi:two-component system chemotaxis response regulator CheY
MKILHIEKELETRKKVKKILSREGYSVISIAAASKAITAVKKEKPSLVLAEAAMPDISGWELYSKIHSIDENIKVAFLSSVEISSELKKSLIKAGVSDYIMKPFTAEGLANRIKKMIITH